MNRLTYSRICSSTNERYYEIQLYPRTENPHRRVTEGGMRPRLPQGFRHVISSFTWPQLKIISRVLPTCTRTPFTHVSILRFSMSLTFSRLRSTGPANSSHHVNLSIVGNRVTSRVTHHRAHVTESDWSVVGLAVKPSRLVGLPISLSKVLSNGNACNIIHGLLFRQPTCHAPDDQSQLPASQPASASDFTI